jgi:hypothetical protein
MHKYTYSRDQLEVWQECRRKYYLKYKKNLRLPDKQSNFELGKNLHSLVNYYLKSHDVSVFEKNMDAETANHWIAVKNHPIIKTKLICTEWSFNAKIGDSKYWLNGRIDAVFYDEKKSKYTITDWKTGQHIQDETEESFQTKTYLYSFFRVQQDLKISLAQEQLEFLYIKTPECKEIKIDYSAQKEKIYEKHFLDIIKNIESFDFNQKIPFDKKEKCQKCQFKVFCA